MRVLIVGCGGFIGENLLRFLASVGFDVQGVSSTDGTGINPDSGLLTPGFSVPDATDAVFYLAQSPHHRQRQMAGHVMAVNVLSAVQIASLARDAGVKNFIYASTGNVYQPSFQPLAEHDPVRTDNWYSLSKVQAEQALMLFAGEMEVTSVRLFGVYGPGQTGRLIPNLIESVRTRREIVLEKNPHAADDEDGLRISLCHVEDVVRILYGLLSMPKVPCINVAGDEAVSIRDIARSIGEVLSIEPVLQLSQRQRGMNLIADTTRLKKLLNPGFIAFKTGIRQTVERHIQESNGG